jgi:predicted DNA-binding protein
MTVYKRISIAPENHRRLKRLRKQTGKNMTTLVGMAMENRLSAELGRAGNRVWPDFVIPAGESWQLIAVADETHVGLHALKQKTGQTVTAVANTIIQEFLNEWGGEV